MAARIEAGLLSINNRTRRGWHDYIVIWDGDEEIGVTMVDSAAEAWEYDEAVREWLADAGYHGIPWSWRETGLP